MKPSIISLRRRTPEEEALLARRDALPIRSEKMIQDIMRLIGERVLILIGGTGSGKSTQMWQIMSEYWPELMAGTRSVMTEPRVVNSLELGARISAERMAHTGDASYALGGRIGYSTGREKLFTKSHRPSLLVNTDGTELRRAGDIRVGIPDIYFVDEVHTYSLDSEFLLWHIRNLMMAHPTMRLVLMSATINPEELIRFFKPVTGTLDIPVLRVPGRTFPVDRQAVSASEFVPSVVTNVQAGGKVLAFVQGKSAIAATTSALSGELDPETAIIGFHARCSAEQRRRTFEFGNSPNEAGAIVSTSALQDGITLGELDTVVDNGLIRQASVDRYGFSRLDTIPASRAEVAQRWGRVGRTKPGTAILASDTPYDARREYPEAAIRLSMPDSQILLSISKGRDPIRASREAAKEGRTAFVNQPPIAHLEASARRLGAIGAIDGDMNITPIGKRISEFPLEPALGRVMFEWVERGIGASMAEVVALVSGRGFLSGNGWKRMLPSGAGKQSDIDASLHILRQLTHAPFSRRGFKAVRSALLSERDRMKDPTDRKPYDTALEELGAREDDPAFAHEPLYRLTDLSCIGINGAQIETLVALRTKLRELVGEEDEVPEARTHENIARALLSGYPDRVFTAQPNKLPGGESSLVHTSHPLAFKFGTSSTVDQLAGTPYFGLPYIIGSEWDAGDLGICSFNMALDPSWLDKDTMWETIASSIEEGIDKPAHSLWTRTERMELSDDDRTKKLASEWLVPFLIQENPALRKIMQERGLTTHDDRLRVAEVLMGLAARSAYLIYPNDRLKTERSLRQDSSFAGLLRNTPSLQGKKTPAPSRRMFGKRS